jgi:putative membrane-bound dehydrogenase-like protein
MALAMTACGFLSRSGPAAESKPESNRPPHAASIPARNQVAGFQVKPGFRIELVAEEPAVASPIAMAFDENGRLFVLERKDASRQRETNDPSGRIRLLEDTEGHGEFRKSSVYADSLPWASAIACYGGGVFVATRPEILFVRDSKTNGIVDVRTPIFAGFDGTNLFGVQALPNNFNWGLDNRIHAASAGVAAFVPQSEARDAPLAHLTEADFSFDPRALTIRAEAGPGQSGLTFDNLGRKFTCDPTRPLRSPRYESRYMDRNPFFAPPPQMVDVASPATTIYRLRSGGVPGPVAEASRMMNELSHTEARTTNVLVATWLTNAQGCVIYRGNAFPSNYVGNAFIIDPSAQVVHRFVLREAGFDITAARALDEKSTEFVLSTNAPFCPTQIINGPDGALYIADKQDGRDRGRIYRIVPLGFEQPPPPRLGKANTYSLVATLSHPNGWHRDTAARLLYERRDPAAAALVAKELTVARSPLARIAALHVLDGLGGLTSARILKGLQDPDERVREHAVRLSERLVQGRTIPDDVWGRMASLTADPSPRVRYQLAFTLGELRRPEAVQVLAGLFMQTPDNVWMQAAIFSSLGDDAGSLLANLANDPRVRGSAIGGEFLRRLATMIGVRDRAEDGTRVLNYISQAPLEPQSALALLESLGDGLRQSGSSLGLLDSQDVCGKYYALASEAVANYATFAQIQLEAIRLLGVGPYTLGGVGDFLLLPFDTGEPETMQAAAIDALGRFDDPRIALNLLQRWNVLSPALRNRAVDALLARTNRVETVLTALETGRINAAALSATHINFLRTHRDSSLSQRATRLFGSVPRQRPEAVRQFRPALGLKGVAERGREIFVGRCAACHQRNLAGLAIGPDLASAKTYGKEQTLMAILQPNGDIRPDYLTHVVETAGGENLVGLLREENALTITLRQLNGREIVLPRDNIQYLQAQSWSLMPAGMETGLTPKDMAGLLEYLQQATATP